MAPTDHLQVSGTYVGLAARQGATEQAGDATARTWGGEPGVSRSVRTPPSRPNTGGMSGHRSDLLSACESATARRSPLGDPAMLRWERRLRAVGDQVGDETSNKAVLWSYLSLG